MEKKEQSLQYLKSPGCNDRSLDNEICYLLELSPDLDTSWKTWHITGATEAFIRCHYWLFLYLCLEQWLSSGLLLIHQKKYTLYLSLVYTTTHLKSKFHEIIGHLIILIYDTLCSILVSFSKMCQTGRNTLILPPRNMSQFILWKTTHWIRSLHASYKGNEFMHRNNTQLDRKSVV